ncbi:MAG: ABC transporter permease subunit, partial [Gammaproteobacteria bacterium]
GWITLRMSGHYLPVATIAWCLGLYYLLGNLDVLGKFDGLTGVPSLSLFGISLANRRHFFYLLWALVIVAVVITNHLLDSRTGRALRAARNGTVMAEAMGVNTFRIKVMVFVLGALLASLSGWLFAYFQHTVNPSPFGLDMGIEYLFMAVLGGIGYVWGAVLGAGVVVILQDRLQDWIPHLLGVTASYEIVVFGALMVLVLRYAQDGLWATIEAHLPGVQRRRDWADASALPQRTRPAHGELVLDAKALRKEFGGLVAVNDVSLQVRAGEIVGLIGPNGAGKSTTFNLLTGVLALTAGEISLHGKSIRGMRSREIAQYGVARTFQHVRMLAGMTVLE